MTGLGWITDAACADLPELPWIAPRRGQPLNPDDLDLMIQTCANCPAQQHCRDYVDQADVTGRVLGRQLAAP